MNKNIIGVLILIVITLLGLYYFKYPDLFINSYKDCKNAGYPIQETYPERCVTKNGKLFTDPIQTYESKIEVRIEYLSNSDNPEETITLGRATNRKDLPYFAIEELFKKPTQEEVSAFKIKNEIILEGESTCNNDYSFSIIEGTATLKICKNIRNSGLMTDARILESIRKTLSQFENINKIVVLDKNNNCLGDLSGKNICLD